MSDNHHHYLVRTFSSPWRETPYPLSSYYLFFFPPGSWEPPIYFLSSWDLLTWTFQMNGVIIHYVTLCVWFLSLGIMFAWSIHGIACIRTWFLFMADLYFIVWRHHGLFISLSVDGHLAFFPLGSTHFFDIHFEMKLSIMTVQNVICYKSEVFVQINITKSKQCYQKL